MAAKVIRFPLERRVTQILAREVWELHTGFEEVDPRTFPHVECPHVWSPMGPSGIGACLSCDLERAPVRVDDIELQQYRPWLSGTCTAWHYFRDGKHWLGFIEPPCTLNRKARPPGPEAA